jgi:PAS domain S-box-containing protein
MQSNMAMAMGEAPGTAEPAARYADDFFRQAMESSAAGIVTLDTAATITYANPSMGTLLGYPADALQGHRLQDFVDPDDLSHFLAARAEDATVAEWRACRPDGTRLWLDESSSPLVDATGAVAGRCIVITDAADHRRDDAPVRDVGRHKDEFLATLAHELRNPLAPIANGLKMLRSAAVPAQEARVIGMLERQVDTLVRLIDDLLDVSRLNDGDITLHRERVALDSVLTAAIETSQPRLDARSHHLIVEQPDGVTLDADPVRLCQVFANLLNNAAGQMRSEGTVWLTAEQVGGVRPSLLVSVRDSAPSIAAEEIDALARAFVNRDETWEHANGIGVGLELVDRLVRLHGGAITVAAGPDGIGTEFQVQLPLLATPAARRKPRTADRAISLLDCRILIVDDNHDAADSLGMLLRHAGATIEVVYDGFSALKTMDQSLPDVVLLDIGMPGLNGYELARRIRERYAGRLPLLVAQTGWGQPVDRQRSTAAGIDYHLVKPVEFGELQRTISSYVQSRPRSDS